MNAEEFRKRGYEMVDYIVNYLDKISERRVTPYVFSGYLIKALPTSAPEKGESYENIMEDVEKFILPGLSHWQHPGFHGYFPGCSSFPGILGVMMSDVIGHPGFDWRYSPSGGEFECLTLDWYGEMLGLPYCFLRKGYKSKGAGIMFRSSSECLFISLLTARVKFLSKLSILNPAISKAALLCSLVAYCIKGPHSRLEKIALVTLVNVKVLDTSCLTGLRGELLDKAIKQDKEIGLIPFFVIIKIGCNMCGQSDRVKEIGLVCKEHGIWLHVDATYAGNAAVCPEYQYLIDGIEYASSFQSSPSNWMLTPEDCSVLFVKNRYRVTDAVMDDRTKRGYSFEERDWCYPSRTECKTLKLFFVMRNYGVQGLQKHIRNHINLAKLFAEYVKQDDRFELMTSELGFTSFRLKGIDILNMCLKDFINDGGKLYVTPTQVRGKYAIRFIMCSNSANEDDIKFAWEIICENAYKVLNLTPERIKRRSAANELFDEFYSYALP